MTSVRNLVLLCLMVLLSGCATETSPPLPEPAPFTIAVIPDTQNYVDYTHQKDEGFAIDAAELFIEQMSWVAERGHASGGAARRAGTRAGRHC